jgi:hypothetical protein
MMKNIIIENCVIEVQKSLWDAVTLFAPIPYCFGAKLKLTPAGEKVITMELSIWLYFLGILTYSECFVKEENNEL